MSKAEKVHTVYQCTEYRERESTKHRALASCIYSVYSVLCIAILHQSGPRYKLHSTLLNALKIQPVCCELCLVSSVSFLLHNSNNNNTVIPIPTPTNLISPTNASTTTTTTPDLTHHHQHHSNSIQSKMLLGQSLMENS